MVASKKPKFAKSRRKGWKKVNIDEIDTFYEDVRLKERVGQPLDEPAFKIDKEAEIEPVLNGVKKGKVLKKLKQTKDLAKNIKAYKSLVPSSRVPPVVVFKNPAQPEKKVKPKTYGKSIKKKKEKWTDLKVGDIWSGTPTKAERKTRLKLKSVLPALELPHPGTSINPAIEDHQDLIKKAAEVELKKLKKDEKIQRLLHGGVTKKTQSQMQKEWLEEMSAGLPVANEDDQEKDDDEIVAEDPDLANPKKVIRAEDRKSKSKRRREMLAKMREKAIREEKEKKKKENKIYQLKRIKKEIAAGEEKHKKNMEIHQKKFEEKLCKPARLGPHKYEDPDIPVSLPGELADRLRLVKTEGDLFEDRLKSLQKRNIIEPRKLILKTQKKNVKYTEKRDCRDYENDLLNK
ncbi:ribosome biogenesis protein NOP53 [Tetranychus urticae]|uniref:Ribosome biogenesis protein NOP53 n=1 Tax=Tetranychus urticae TaxID=32264 RepID=T1KSB4_TETUR|nr:ribosome biogenesis protein NOP53 [Tetranychus urticae]